MGDGETLRQAAQAALIELDSIKPQNMGAHVYRTREGLRAALIAPQAPRPVDMVLHCPSCHTQHIDAPELHHLDAMLERNGLPGAPDASWSNPPHRSHLCGQCGTIWRPADVCTNGVASTTTRGKSDTWGPA